MTAERKVDIDLDDLPMDVFELPDHGLTAESLTAGHGMHETAASCGCAKVTSCTVCGCGS
jgi:hypothetical protein